MLPPYPYNSKNVKLVNRSLIRALIRDHEPISRNELAKISGLTPAAVTTIVKQLIKDGAVCEIGHGESSGGRRPIHLMLNPSITYILACRLQKNYLLMAIVDLKNNVHAQKTLTIDTSSPGTVAGAMLENFQDLLTQAQVPKEKVSFVSVASPGLVNPETGTIKISVNLGWENAPLGETLAEAFGIPVHIENVSNASALAEKIYGHGRECSHLIYMGLSVGIGAGIIANNQIYRGALGYAGEIGHMAMTLDEGPECKCGSYGCFEAYCGINAVMDRVRTGIAKGLVSPNWDNAANGLNLPIIFQMLRDGEPFVKSVFAMVANIIGVVVANLINLYNPEVVVLGGELMQAGEEFLGLIRQGASAHALRQLSESVKIVRSEMADDPGMKGAAAIALQKIFEQDLI